MNRQSGNVVQFDGETSWGAVVNHYSLNIEEESAFEQFCKRTGVGNNASLAEMTAAYHEWQNSLDNA